MYSKTYTLLCQTPIIHFQPDQEGATLRATEVKPKLDRYLMGKLGREAVEPWLIPGQKGALNYKLRFQAEKTRQVELGFKTPYDIYYGNMGDGPKKKGILGNVKMTVICMIPQLLAAIDRHVGDFFIVHNFGTMQDKGFGSFLVEGYSAEPVHIAGVLKDVYGAAECYCFPAGELPFSRIKTLYSVMKSGVNHGGYQRSLLFLYMHERYRMGNEKAWLKLEGLAPAIGRKPQGGLEEHDPYYVRALLGVGDHLEFKESTEKENRRKRKIQISNPSGEIERLPSPIFFKVAEGKVYYVARRLNKKIYGVLFQFSSSTGSKKLSVPTEEQLGEAFIDEFLEYCFLKFPGVTIQGLPKSIQRVGEG